MAEDIREDAHGGSVADGVRGHRMTQVVEADVRQVQTPQQRPMGRVKRRRRDGHHVAVAPLVRAAEGLVDGLGYRQVSRAGVALGRLVDETAIREADEAAPEGLV